LALPRTAPALPQSGAADILPGETADFSPEEDLTELDLEDLLDVEVTVVSRQKESLKDAPAAVYVVTGEEIRRAGHATIQDALRMVPGVFVSRWRTSDWDVTIRGFGPGTSDVNLAYLNQVLIMIDGVVVYTPLYAGTWWGLQDIDMQNVDRIEVIRGPSGILWGANAFHGVVNVITKESSENQGQRVSVRTSNDTSFVTLRSTGTLAEGVNYSAFARRSRYDSLHQDAPFISEQATDLFDWGIDSGGLRLDGVTDGGYRWRLDGRGYEADVGRAFQTGPTTFITGGDRQYGGQLSYTL
jgi:iron complex outermembrane receptor protein